MALVNACRHLAGRVRNPSPPFRGEREGPLAHRRCATRQAHARVRRKGQAWEDEVGSAGALASPTSPQPSPPQGAEREREGAAIDRALLPTSVIPVSALTGEGLPALIAALVARIAKTYDIAAPVLTRARHREALETAHAALRRSLATDLAELRAEDLRLAWRSLGRITGRVDVEDLLDVIFRDFCLGK